VSTRGEALIFHIEFGLRADDMMWTCIALNFLADELALVLEDWVGVRLPNE
jgi:hypothetical protein